MDDKTFVECRAVPGAKVTLFYRLDTGLGAETAYKCEPLKEMYQGIFVRTFTLFYGETLQYYFQIDEGDKDNTKKTSERSVSMKKVEGAGYQMMMELIEAGTLPSAVFAASDPIAIGAMRALYQKGYRIPEDISVMGFDDINVAKFSNPPLTTVHAPADFMGQFAAHYIQLLAESNTKLSYNMPVRMTLPCEITIRDTCGASSDL